MKTVCQVSRPRTSCMPVDLHAAAADAELAEPHVVLEALADAERHGQPRAVLRERRVARARGARARATRESSRAKPGSCARGADAAAARAAREAQQGESRRSRCARASRASARRSAAPAPPSRCGAHAARRAGAGRRWPPSPRPASERRVAALLDQVADDGDAIEAQRAERIAHAGHRHERTHRPTARRGAACARAAARSARRRAARRRRCPRRRRSA